MLKDYTKLNEYLSDLHVLNVKLHNLHWNVVGKQFMQIHEFTEELYDDLFEKFDEIAEVIKMRNERPLAKVKDYLKNSSVQELDKDKYNTTEVLEILQDDYTKLKGLATDIRNSADQEGDFEIVAILEDHVAGYSKNLWFIKSMLA